MPSTLLQTLQSLVRLIFELAAINSNRENQFESRDNYRGNSSRKAERAQKYANQCDSTWTGQARSIARITSRFISGHVVKSRNAARRRRWAQRQRFTQAATSLLETRWDVAAYPATEPTEVSQAATTNTTSPTHEEVWPAHKRPALRWPSSQEPTLPARDDTAQPSAPGAAQLSPAQPSSPPGPGLVLSSPAKSSNPGLT